MYSRQHDKALASYNHARELNPNDAELLAEMASILVYAGRPEQAIDQVKEAMRLNPYHEKWYPLYLGWAYEAAGMPQEAIATLEPLIEPNPAEDDTLGAVHPGVGLRRPQGRQDGRRPQVAEQVLAREPGFSIADFEATNPYKTKELAERAANAMRRAGLPD